MAAIIPPPGPGGGPLTLTPLPAEPLMLQEVLLGKRLAGVLIGTGGSNVSKVRCRRVCRYGVSGVG